MPKHKIVTHLKNGALLKGITDEFRPNMEQFFLHLEDGDTSEIRIEDVKAVFFVKDLDGDRDYNEQYQDAIPGGGKKIEVTFADGEVFVGFATSYSPGRRGWFFLPADVGSNNVRVFAVSSAVKDVQMMS